MEIKCIFWNKVKVEHPPIPEKKVDGYIKSLQ